VNKWAEFNPEIGLDDGVSSRNSWVKRGTVFYVQFGFILCGFFLKLNQAIDNQFLGKEISHHI